MFQKLLLSLMGASTLTSSTLTTINVTHNISAGTYDQAICEAIYNSGEQNQYWTTFKADTFNPVENLYATINSFNYSISFNDQKMKDSYNSGSFDADEILLNNGKPLSTVDFPKCKNLYMDLIFHYYYVAFSNWSKIRIILI